MKCISCRKEFKKGVVFKCPSCCNKTIARCSGCKRQVTPYKCICEFEGP